MKERWLAGGALVAAMVATVLQLKAVLVPSTQLTAQTPSPRSPLMLLTRDRPPGSKERASLKTPMPLDPGQRGQSDQIIRLMSESDPHLQLWALEVACWMHTYAPAEAQQLAETGLSNQADPRAQVFGAAVIGCSPERSTAIRQLAALLDGRHGEVAAVAAATELARLSASDQVEAVSKVSAQVSDEGLALLADWAAWTLGHPDERFSGAMPAGL